MIPEAKTIHFIEYYDTQLRQRREEFSTFEEKDRRIDQLVQGECFAILSHGEEDAAEKQPESQQCQNCRFWHGSYLRTYSPSHSGYGEVGSCRRMPPIPTENRQESTHPITHPQDWCGEWRQKCQE